MKNQKNIKNINKTILGLAKATQQENIELKALLKETVRLFGGEYGKGKKYDDCLGGRLIEEIKSKIELNQNPCLCQLI